MRLTAAAAGRLVIGMVVSFIGFVSYADQVTYFSPKSGKRVLGLFKNVRQVRFFCQPCGDRKSVLQDIVVVELSYTPNDRFKLLKINGRKVDLAYLYVPYEGKWYNVAMLLEFPVTGVSRVLEEPQ